MVVEHVTEILKCRANRRVRPSPPSPPHPTGPATTRASGTGTATAGASTAGTATTTGAAATRATIGVGTTAGTSLRTTASCTLGATSITAWTTTGATGATTGTTSVAHAAHIGFTQRLLNLFDLGLKGGPLLVGDAELLLDHLHLSLAHLLGVHALPAGSAALDGTSRTAPVPPPATTPASRVLATVLGKGCRPCKDDP
jgi:hypothetical protein